MNAELDEVELLISEEGTITQWLLQPVTILQTLENKQTQTYLPSVSKNIIFTMGYQTQESRVILRLVNCVVRRWWTIVDAFFKHCFVVSEIFSWSLSEESDEQLDRGTWLWSRIILRQLLTVEIRQSQATFILVITIQSFSPDTNIYINHISLTITCRCCCRRLQCCMMDRR